MWGSFVVDLFVFVYLFVFFVCLYDFFILELFWFMVSCWKWVLFGILSDLYNFFINLCIIFLLLRLMMFGEGVFGLIFIFLVLDFVVFVLFSELFLCVEVLSGIDICFVNFFWLFESFLDLVILFVVFLLFFMVVIEFFILELLMMYGFELMWIFCFDGFFGIKFFLYDVDWFKILFLFMYGSKFLDFLFFLFCELYLEVIWLYCKEFFG